MTEEAYVSFETAKLLKEKGFDELVKSYYTESGLEGYMFALKTTKNTELNNEFISRPTLQMAMKWLREVHNLQIIIIPVRTKRHKNWTFEIYKEFNPLTIDVFCSSTYEEACEDAIKYCLENLI